MDIKNILRHAVQLHASDLHLTVGVPPVLRINGDLIQIDDEILTVTLLELIINQITTKEQREKLNNEKSIDHAYTIPELGRFRINVFFQKEVPAIAIRVHTNVIRSLEELKMEDAIKQLALSQRGLVLVTGPAGSGKTTTLAAMIHHINTNKKSHIITLEDPIEFLHQHRHCIINQREIGIDTNSFYDGVREAVRQNPDVILIGEMRDAETISAALTAAETGHLVLGTLHSINAAKTADRIIDSFPPYQQQQIRAQLALTLRGIVAQQLIPLQNAKGRIAATEILISTPAIQTLIREGKNHQINNVIETGSTYGMQTMDRALINLYNRQLISFEQAEKFSFDKEFINTMR